LTILIQGPSGGGKSLLARAIHAGGRRAAKPFMEINCAALPAALLESELFGHEKGAFTDAKHAKPGLFELADGGTLLLDEIGDMDLILQAKLLRVIEDRRFKRVGGVSDIEVDCCIIATTNVDLETAVEKGRFRLDLYYRLKVVPLEVPTLASRPEDIPLLVESLIARLNQELHTKVQGISRGALSVLCRHPWPGNVRELRNVLERIMLMNNQAAIVVDHLPPELLSAAMQSVPTPATSASDAQADGSLAEPVAALLQHCASLDEIEREVIRQVLAAADGNLSQAGKKLGLHRDTLRYRARKHGVMD
jgi:two-component system, NtrC family, response regulator AtoC